MKPWFQYLLVSRLYTGKCLAKGLAVALIVSGSMAWAERLPYRVAGILAVDDRQYRAVIELSADEQGIFQEGDVLGNGTIAEVSADGVTVTVGSDRYFLALQGDGSAVYHEFKDPAAPAVSSVEVNYRRVHKALSAVLADAVKRDDGNALRRTDNQVKDPAAPAVSSAAVNYGRALKELSAAHADSGRNDDSDVLRRDVNRILRLPEQAQITAIDREPVASARSMIATLKTALANQAVPQLLISGVPGMEEVYVIPAPVPEKP